MTSNNNTFCVESYLLNGEGKDLIDQALDAVRAHKYLKSVIDRAMTDQSHESDPPVEDAMSQIQDARNVCQSFVQGFGPQDWQDLALRVESLIDGKTDSTPMMRQRIVSVCNVLARCNGVAPIAKALSSSKGMDAHDRARASHAATTQRLAVRAVKLASDLLEKLAKLAQARQAAASKLAQAIGAADTAAELRNARNRARWAKQDAKREAAQARQNAKDAAKREAADFAAKRLAAQQAAADVHVESVKGDKPKTAKRGESVTTVNA